MGDALEQLPVTGDESENIMLEDTGVNIWIDKYADVFSDFDTRPLIKRKLSNDFITEICKMVREEPTVKVELNFNILDDMKDVEVENIIINHMKALFTNNQKAEQESVRKT